MEVAKVPIAGWHSGLAPSKARSLRAKLVAKENKLYAAMRRVSWALVLAALALGVAYFGGAIGRHGFFFVMAPQLIFQVFNMWLAPMAAKTRVTSKDDKALLEEASGSAAVCEVSILQDQVPSGLDVGVLWFTEGTLHFLGNRTSFDLGRSDVEAVLQRSLTKSGQNEFYWTLKLKDQDLPTELYIVFPPSIEGLQPDEIQQGIDRFRLGINCPSTLLPPLQRDPLIHTGETKNEKAWAFGIVFAIGILMAAITHTAWCLLICLLSVPAAIVVGPNEKKLRVLSSLDAKYGAPTPANAPKDLRARQT